MILFGGGEGGGGRLNIYRSRLDLVLVDTMCMHGVVKCTFSIAMAVSVREFSWVALYLACGCATLYDNPLFNVSGWKGVREFSYGEKLIYWDEKYYEYFLDVSLEVWWVVDRVDNKNI